MMKLKEEFKNAKVNVEYPCPECEGKGIVMNALWEKYYEKTQGEIDYAAWFWNNEQIPVQGIPDEYEVCGECNGSKFVDGMVKLEDLFEQMSLTETVMDVAVAMAGGGA